MAELPSLVMINRRQAALHLTMFLVAFFGLWTLRATWFYEIDDSIVSPTLRAAYSCLLKLVLWVFPAAAFAWVLRTTSPATYLGLSAWPSRQNWMRCLGVTGAFIFVVLVLELVAGKKSFSAAGLAAFPFTRWLLQLVLAPWIEEVLFRGLVLKELLTLTRTSLAITLTSLLFVAVHLPYWLSHGGVTRALAANSVGVFVFSIVASWLYAKSDSIWPPTVAHIANNIVASLLVVGDA